MNFEMIGPALVLALGCIGSAIGCGIAGMASHGVMSRVDENHGKFIGMSVLPSSSNLCLCLDVAYAQCYHCQNT